MLIQNRHHRRKDPWHAIVSQHQRLVLMVLVLLMLLSFQSLLLLRQREPEIQKSSTRGSSLLASHQVPVMIVSADGRRPRFGTEHVTAQNATFYEFAALINLAYAEKQGYDYSFFVFEDNTGSGCSHRLYGQRHVAWCKLLALEKALALTSSSQILWLDSDAAWVLQDLSVESFLTQTGLGCSAIGYNTLKEGDESTVDMYRGCLTANCNTLKADASLLFFANRPFNTHAVMSGTFILKSSEKGRQMLSRWWNINACNTRFPWEQRAANYALYPNLNGHVVGHGGGGVEILSTSHNFHPGPTEAVRHYGHFNHRNKTRDELMRDAFRLAGLDEERDFGRLVAKIQKHIIELGTNVLKRLGESLTDVTWDKDTGKPDDAWMVERNYSMHSANWSDCGVFNYLRPNYE